MGKGRTLAVFVILCLLGLPMSQASASSESSQSLRRTRSQIRATRARLHNAKADDNEIRAALNLITSKLYAAENDLAVARGHLHRIDVQIGSAQRKVEQLADATRGRQDAIDERAAALYMMGPIAGPDAALSGATSLGDYVERAGALDFIGTFDRTVLQDLAALRHQQVLAKRELKLERASASVVAKEVADRVSLVAEAAAAKREAHEIAARRVRGYEQELKDQLAQEAMIKRIIASKGSRFHGTIEGDPGRYGFQWPTNCCGHKINSPYGPRGGGFHTGIDIECSTGDPLAAAKDGKVIAAEYAGGYGNMIIIDHGDGHHTLYAHNSRLYVNDGQQVARGQVISACGATGNATGSHLHFEMRLNGYTGGSGSCDSCVNPRPYLP